LVKKAPLSALAAVLTLCIINKGTTKID